MAHRRGESRRQAALFPVMLDELVSPDALVRVVDAWIASLDLTRMAFSKTQAQVMGRPPYDSADLTSYTCAVISTACAHRVHWNGSAIATAKSCSCLVDWLRITRPLQNSRARTAPPSWPPRPPSSSLHGRHVSSRGRSLQSTAARSVRWHRRKPWAARSTCNARIRPSRRKSLITGRVLRRPTRTKGARRQTVVQCRLP